VDAHNQTIRDWQVGGINENPGSAAHQANAQRVLRAHTALREHAYARGDVEAVARHQRGMRAARAAMEGPF